MLPGLDAAAEAMAEDRAHGFARDGDSAAHRPVAAGGDRSEQDGPHTLAVDCQVLQADGGTRTACISAAYVALHDATAKLPPEMPIPQMLSKSTTHPITGETLPRYDASLYAIRTRR